MPLILRHRPEVPPDYNAIAQLLPYMTEAEKKELDTLIAPRSGEIDWMPLPGPQTAAFNCKANMLLYGGAAGGGKTDLLLGLAYYKHHRSAIFRREYTNLTAIMDRASELFAIEDTDGKKLYGSYNGFWRRWTFFDRKGHILEYGAAENIGSEKKFQGRAHDGKLFDEGPQFTYNQFNYLRGWNRSVSTSPVGQLLQTVVTCNPPTAVDERWINMPWAPWLDKAKFPVSERPGKLLWFISVDGRFVPVDGPGWWRKCISSLKGYKKIAAASFPKRDDEHVSLSYTFIPSSLKDNPYLSDGQYESVLQSLPEPLRSMLLFGDFQAGISDDPWQLLPTEWIEAAARRWVDVYGGKPPAGMAMTQLGVDVARGGDDRTVLSPRWAKFFGTQDVYKGLQTKDGMKVAGIVINKINPLTVVQIDAIGIGASPLDWLRSQNVRVIAFIGGASVEDTDKSGYLHFKNKRALAGWRFREALDPQNKMDIAIPPDPELIAELASFRFKVSAGGIALEDKADIKQSLGRSPDKAEAIFYAGLPTHPLMVDADMIARAVSAGEPGEESEDREIGSSAAADRDAPWNI